MHWSGQVAIFLCLLSWVATVPLVAKLMNIRNAWTEQVNELTVSNDEKDAEIAVLQQKRRVLLDTIDVTKRSWGLVAPDIEMSRPIPATGAMTMEYGLNSGLGQPNPDKRPMLIHVFRPQTPDDVKDVGRQVTFHVEDVVGGAPASATTDKLTGRISEVEDAAARLTVDVKDADGNVTEYVVPVDAVVSFEYLGEFDVQPLDNSADIQPNWLTRQDDITRIRPSDDALLAEFRIRERVPTAYSGPIKAMQTQLHAGDALYDQRQTLLDRSQKNLEGHQAELQAQEVQLVGTPDESGLQQRLLQAQQARNEALARLDDLRRRIDAAYEEQQTLVTEVKGLAGRLPGADD